MSSFKPGWRPKSEADLIVAANEGWLDEATVNIEFKEELGVTPAARNSFAKELASLALYGGVLIIGVVDLGGRRSEATAKDCLKAVKLEGLEQRVASIAQMKPDPPIHVELRQIPSDTGPGFGYLVVDVPRSHNGPHMVDDVFYGRDGTTRRRLTSEEVRFYHRQALEMEDRARSDLKRFADEHPKPNSGAKPSIDLHMVAFPLPFRTDAALGWWGDQIQAETTLSELVVRSAFSVGGAGGVFLRQYVHQGPDGKLICNKLLKGGTPEHDGYADVDLISITNRGDIHGYTARLGESKEDIAGGAVRKIYDYALYEFCRSMVKMSGNLGQEMDYNGSWVYAMQIEGLEGAIMYDGPDVVSRLSYQRDHYCSTATATTGGALTTPGMISKQLIGQLCRGFQIEETLSARTTFSDGENT